VLVIGNQLYLQKGSNPGGATALRSFALIIVHFIAKGTKIRYFPRSSTFISEAKCFTHVSPKGHVSPNPEKHLKNHSMNYGGNATFISATFDLIW